MRRFDYSFLAALALPEDAAALEASTKALASRLEGSRVWAGRGMESAAAALKRLEPKGPPGLAQALAQAEEKDFLHILASALDEGGLEQEKSLALGQALSAYDSARRSQGDSLGLIACAALDCARISPVPGAPLGCGLLLARSLLCQAGPALWAQAPLAETFWRYRCLFRPAFQKSDNDSAAHRCRIVYIFPAAMNCPLPLLWITCTEGEAMGFRIDSCGQHIHLHLMLF